MPASVRAKGSIGGNKQTPGTPMSERQQMALLMQMTSKSNDADTRHSEEGGSLRSKDRNERGETFLHLASIKGDIEQVSKLLAHHADPNVTDFAGWTPLHEACNHGWLEVACRLIQAGANVNAKGFDCYTPLHDAVLNGHIKLVKLLVERGANINAKNSKGKTPLEYASPEIAAVLMDPNLPISEPSVSTRLQPRSRDEKKVSESPANKQKAPSEETMDTTKASEDVYEFKAVKESSQSPDNKMGEQIHVESEVADSSSNTTQATEDTSAKRSFSEVADGGEESTNDDESKRKKRKDDNVKESKTSTPQRNSNQGKAQSNKQTGAQNKGSTTATSNKGQVDTKSPSLSPKPATASDAELEDGKSDLKVPPLKIVIPQSSSNEQEIGSTRNGKNSSQRSHQALPYVVPSSNNESVDKDGAPSGTNSPTENSNIKNDEKKENTAGNDDQRSGHHQRVLRSSHRTGNVQGSADRSSNNSSPQLQRSHSPSPSASPSTPSNQPETSTSAIHNNSTALTTKSSDVQVSTNNETEQATPATNLNSSASTPTVELHPRKRKMKPNKEPPIPCPTEPLETPVISEIHPHEQPITNCYQLFLNIRKQIEKRRKGLFPVQPKPPQGFKDYLMNRCTYVLAGTAPTTPNITYPSTLPAQLKDLFNEQEKERYRLRMQHVIEKEKLVLSVEQEILRVHGRAARALANQSLPFSVCTILRDEEVYNLITPEQEEKDRNARSRYNGRLFLSWLQDVDDKWEKIKEHMLLRHHNEAESLHAVQKMDWEWKLKELSLCDAKSTPSIDELHVPMVHVSDDFDLLPA